MLRSPSLEIVPETPEGKRCSRFRSPRRGEILGRYVIPDGIHLSQFKIPTAASDPSGLESNRMRHHRDGFDDLEALPTGNCLRLRRRKKDRLQMLIGQLQLDAEPPVDDSVDDPPTLLGRHRSRISLRDAHVVAADNARRLIENEDGRKVIPSTEGYLGAPGARQGQEMLASAALSIDLDTAAPVVLRNMRNSYPNDSRTKTSRHHFHNNSVLPTRETPEFARRTISDDSMIIKATMYPESSEGGSSADSDQEDGMEVLSHSPREVSQGLEDVGDDGGDISSEEGFESEIAESEDTESDNFQVSNESSGLQDATENKEDHGPKGVSTNDQSAGQRNILAEDDSSEIIRASGGGELSGRKARLPILSPEDPRNAFRDFQITGRISVDAGDITKLMGRSHSEWGSDFAKKKKRGSAKRLKSESFRCQRIGEWVRGL